MSNWVAATSPPPRTCASRFSATATTSSATSRAEDFAGEPFCYLTTTGRQTGLARTIEIWFALKGDRLYMLAGGRERAHWVRNLNKDPAVTVRLGDQSFLGEAYVVADPPEDALARRLVAAKYQDWREGRPLSGWARTSLPVAVRLNLAGR